MKNVIIKLTGESFARDEELDVLHSARSHVQSEAMDLLGGYQFNSASPLPDELLQKYSARSAQMTEELMNATKASEIESADSKTNTKNYDSEHSLVKELERDGKELELQHDQSKSSLSPSLKSMEEVPLGDMFRKEVFDPVMSKEELLASTLTQDDEPEELLPSTLALIANNVIPDPKNESIRSGIPKAKAKAKLITRPKLPKGKTTSGEDIKEEEPLPIPVHPITGRPLARKNSNPSLPPKPQRNARSEPRQVRKSNSQSRIPVARQLSQSPSQDRHSAMRSPRTQDREDSLDRLEDEGELSPVHNLDGDLIKSILEKEVLDHPSSRQGSQARIGIYDAYPLPWDTLG